jgi:hypothetical protein
MAILAPLAAAQKSSGVTIREPGVYELANLFNQADTVVLVNITAGDTHVYPVAVYKAETIKTFKGASEGETIYFGPYVGERLGSQYILFLRNVPTPLTPKTTSSAAYGAVHYQEVFDEGYSSMEISYECVFNGKNIAQKCDYGVRVCTDYVKLPKMISTFPPTIEQSPFGCRWVRKTLFLSLLDNLGQSRK